MRLIVIIPFLTLVMGCGYRFQDKRPDDGPVSISIPYIKGDVEGQLNTELARILSNDPHFDYVQNGGMVQLEVVVVSDGDERIGYRYDRDPNSGKRRVNIVGTENRRNLIVDVKLIDAYSQEVLIGPIQVKGRADYDYVDSNSIRDLTFTNSKGLTQTVINFSMGQLDSIEVAHDDAFTPIYRQIAQKIVDGIISQGW